MRALATALIREGHVVTTEAKGKSLRGLADRLVTIAKGSDELQARRQLQMFFGKRDVANVLVDRIVPINADRDSGYTTLSVVGARAGDNAQMVEIKWMVMPDNLGSLRNPDPAPKNERKTERSKTIKSSKLKLVKKVAAVKTPAVEKVDKKVVEKVAPAKAKSAAPKAKVKKTAVK